VPAVMGLQINGLRDSARMWCTDMAQAMSAAALRECKP
jgi:hypothetical protein